MRILNGRTLGDLMGKFTYIGYNGISTVDYVLGSENFLMLNYIHSFEVEDLTLLSDHRQGYLNVEKGCDTCHSGGHLIILTFLSLFIASVKTVIKNFYLKELPYFLEMACAMAE